MINALLRLQTAFFLGTLLALAFTTPQDVAQQDLRRLQKPAIRVTPEFLGTMELPDDFEATVTRFAYDVGDPFTYATGSIRKYSVELLTDGRFGIYWPVGADSTGKCYTAWIILDAVTSIREDVEKRLLYGSRWAFIPEEHHTVIVGKCG